MNTKKRFVNTFFFFSYRPQLVVVLSFECVKGILFTAFSLFLSIVPALSIVVEQRMSRKLYAKYTGLHQQDPHKLILSLYDYPVEGGTVRWHGNCSIIFIRLVWSKSQHVWKCMCCK